MCEGLSQFSVILDYHDFLGIQVVMFNGLYFTSDNCFVAFSILTVEL